MIVFCGSESSMNRTTLGILHSILRSGVRKVFGSFLLPDRFILDIFLINLKKTKLNINYTLENKVLGRHLHLNRFIFTEKEFTAHTAAVLSTDVDRKVVIYIVKLLTCSTKENKFVIHWEFQLNVNI